MLCPLLISLSLLSAPETDGNRDHIENTTGEEHDHSYDYAEVVAALNEALVEINTDPSAGIESLTLALERLYTHAPALARDPETRKLRVFAELALARTQLASGDRYAAEATVDATLETLGDMPLDPANLGPSLGALVEERRRLLDARGEARLRVVCDRPCRVLVDERNVGEVEQPGSARELALPLGRHRVWVEALTEGGEPSWQGSLELDSAGATTELHFPEHGSDAVEPPAPRFEAGGPRSAIDRGTLRTRVAPRWVEVGSLTAGAAALIAGAVLWGLDSRCPGGADPNDPSACPQLYDTKTGGIALVSAGLAAALTGGVMLTVDETRIAGRRSRELGVVWTARF